MYCFTCTLNKLLKNRYQNQHSIPMFKRTPCNIKWLLLGAPTHFYENQIKLLNLDIFSPDGVNQRYFKLKLFYLTEFIVWDRGCIDTILLISFLYSPHTSNPCQIHRFFWTQRSAFLVWMCRLKGENP